MANVNVVRFQRRKKLSDPASPLVYSIKQQKGDAKVFDLKRLSEEIEMVGSLSAEDVFHVLQSFVRAMRTVLRDGNRVKVDGLGTFFITLSCPGVAIKDECTIKSIQRVNIRFMVDGKIRLVNDSTATTRGGNSNVMFNLLPEKKDEPVKPNEPSKPEEPAEPV